jgi:hypothetical protein
MSSFFWNLLRLSLHNQKFNVTSSIAKTKRSSAAEKKEEVKKIGGGEDKRTKSVPRGIWDRD